MKTVVNLQPPLSAPKVIEADVEGGLLVNIAGILHMARNNGTPQCRSLTRFYAAEYRALERDDHPPAEREIRAFRAAWDRLVRKHGVPPIGWGSSE